MQVAQGLAGCSGRAADVLWDFLKHVALSDFFSDSTLSVIFNLFSRLHLTFHSATAGLFINPRMWQTRTELRHLISPPSITSLPSFLKSSLRVVHLHQSYTSMQAAESPTPSQCSYLTPHFLTMPDVSVLSVSRNRSRSPQRLGAWGIYYIHTFSQEKNCWLNGYLLSLSWGSLEEGLTQIE